MNLLFIRLHRVVNYLDLPWGILGMVPTRLQSGVFNK